MRLCGSDAQMLPAVIPGKASQPPRQGQGGVRLKRPVIRQSLPQKAETFITCRAKAAADARDLGDSGVMGQLALGAAGVRSDRRAA